MGLMMLVALTVTVAALGWTGVRLRTQAPGPDRDATVNSFWFLGGSIVLLLALAMGLAPFKMPVAVRWATLAASGALTAVGGVNARRLVAAKRQALVSAGEGAKTLADQIETLEGIQALDRGLPTRLRVVLMGGKLGIAGSAAWAASIIPTSGMVALFGVFAIGGVAWAGADLVEILRARRSRIAFEKEMDALLPPGTDAER